MGLQVVTVSFNGTDKEFQSIQALRVALDRFGEHSQFELWISIEDGPSICMLRNEEHAFLMYLRFPGDSGFVSGGESTNKEPIAYTLSNGQVDQYPQSWSVPVEQCFEALVYFFANDGARPQGISWHES